MAKLIILTVLAVVSGAWCYSAGAPESVCDDMTPKHPVEPQKSKLPYTVSVNKKEVNAGDVVEITVGGKPFKGVLLQVREGNKAVGSFLIPDDDKYTKAITCHGNKGSAATHKNSTDKKDLVFKWKAPQASGNYVVYLTAAQDGGVFWVAKPTQTIKVK
ncbi:putative defense protein Hdd11 [Aethina tumida]|uniref:putative defense protein Hdd11 n=1 Tax=Aethina tumida TaxID=116153 RepID=UPI00096B32AF|nr:putative defense protein Hdd11 [Aethina tumida]